MSFHPRRALAVFWKEVLDLRLNKGLLGSMLVLPAVLVLVPAGVVYAYARSSDESSLRTMALFYDPTFSIHQSAARFLIEKTLTDWFGMYLVMPVFVPILISSQSIAGEKERRTLEPLLASPITAAELVAGKSLAAVLPAVVISYGAYAALCVCVDAVAWRFTHAWLLPNVLWTVGVVFIAPLFAFLGNGIAVLVSARVAESRLAQQISALVVLPLVGLVGGQMAGYLRAGISYYALQGAIILVLDVLLLGISVRVLDRERLVSRWV